MDDFKLGDYQKKRGGHRLLNMVAASFEKQHCEWKSNAGDISSDSSRQFHPGQWGFQSVNDPASKGPASTESIPKKTTKKLFYNILLLCRL
jgi:hypothetical protein